MDSRPETTLPRPWELLAFVYLGLGFCDETACPTWDALFLLATPFVEKILRILDCIPAL